MKRTCRIVNGETVWDPPFTPEEEAAARDRFHDMVAHRKGPFLMTDSVYCEGRCNGNQFEATPWVGDHHLAVAKSEGVDITGKVYEPQMAEYPGDPKAWVTGRGDIQRYCEEVGANCYGAVQARHHRTEPVKEEVVAPDLLEMHTDMRIEKNPELAHKPREEVKEETLDIIRPPWSR